MVRHVILWKLKGELSAERKEEVKSGIKTNLEGLCGKIEGADKPAYPHERIAVLLCGFNVGKSFRRRKRT